MEAVMAPVPGRPNCEKPTPAARLWPMRIPALTSNTAPLRIRWTSVTVAVSSYNEKLLEAVIVWRWGWAPRSALMNPALITSSWARAGRRPALHAAKTIKQKVTFFTRVLSLSLELFTNILPVVVVFPAAAFEDDDVALRERDRRRPPCLFQEIPNRCEHGRVLRGE